MTTVTLELTPDMLERIERCREAGERLEDCALDLLWLGVLRHLGERPDDEPTVPLSEMRALYGAYVKCLEAAMDRICALGGECDSVDVMEEGDPALCRARIAMWTAEGANTP